jgi:hypothetical protein
MAAGVQGDLGPKAPEENCRSCLAWGRNTCASLLARTSIASWGGILMAPLLAAIVAMSLLLSQRIAAQKQALAQIISECRQDVGLAYRTLQAKGRIGAISAEDLKSALLTMWDTGDSDTQARRAHMFAGKHAAIVSCALRFQLGTIPRALQQARFTIQSSAMPKLCNAKGNAMR